MTILEPFLTAPVFPATILMVIVVGWALLWLVGVLGIDSPDVGSPDTPDLAEAAGSLGGAVFQWLNLSTLPLVFWVSIFAIAWWSVSLGFWSFYDQTAAEADVSEVIPQILRNAALALGATKLITNFMVGWFQSGESYNRDTLIGTTCEVWTATATANSGQARVPTDAAPLLLNIRTDGPDLPRGTLVEIVDYDPQRRIFTVTRAPVEEHT